MPVKLDHLEKLVHQQLKDAYSAEQQLLEAIPRMRDASSDPGLAEAFDAHLEETRAHVERVERVCDLLGASPKGHRCRAMEGLIEEAREVLDGSDADDAVRDAALICAAQKVEHYEIALYGCLVEYTDRLANGTASMLLQQTLDEEHGADAKLTGIAVGTVNESAATTDRARSD